jgi:hypothetical protein
MKTNMQKEAFSISSCPSCGSSSIRKITGKWSGTYRGKRFYRNCPRIFRVSQLSRKSLSSPSNAENTGKLPSIFQIPRRAARFLNKRDQENPQQINTN